MDTSPKKESHGRLRQAVPLLRLFGAVALWLAVGIAAVWAFGALWYFDPWPAWVRMAAAGCFAIGAAAAILRLSRSRARRIIAVGVLVVWLLWLLRTPSNDLAWTLDQARMPAVTFNGDTVTIDNFRFATYQSGDDYDVRWETRRFDHDALESVDFVIEPFASWRGPAHTFLTFGFSDGRHVSISVEIRKEQGESFSPLAALFRQYEIMYVIGDERDLIGLRVNIRKNPVYLFPIRASREQVRTLFVAMLERTNRLRERPEFYNTIVNTCTTNIVRHLEHVAHRDVPLDLRVMLPGYADELAFELELVDFDGGVAEARERFRIAGPAALDADGRAWSRKIRQR